MRSKAEYKSAIRSRRMIRDALVALMQEKDINKITVTDIVTRADINRGTFYAHYQDIRAVLEQIENEIIEKMLELLGEFHYKSFFANPLPLLTKVARYLEKDLEFYRLLINSNGSEQFLTKLKGIFVSRLENDPEIPHEIKKSAEYKMHAYFFAGGIVNLYQAWFHNEVKQSLNEVSMIISNLIIDSSAIFLGESK